MSSPECIWEGNHRVVVKGNLVRSKRQQKRKTVMEKAKAPTLLSKMTIGSLPWWKMAPNEKSRLIMLEEVCCFSE